MEQMITFTSICVTYFHQFSMEYILFLNLIFLISLNYKKKKLKTKTTKYNLRSVVISIITFFLQSNKRNVLAI